MFSDTVFCISITLTTKLKPYLDVKAKDAQTLIKKTPLTITSIQAEEIDKAVKKKHIEQIKLKYNSVPGNKKKFIDIPKQAQTVIASVSFQYGTGLATRTAKFWKAVTTQDWKEGVKILNNFGDAYPTRRKKEAKLLGEIK